MKKFVFFLSLLWTVPGFANEMAIDAQSVESVGIEKNDSDAQLTLVVGAKIAHGLSEPMQVQAGHRFNVFLTASLSNPAELEILRFCQKSAMLAMALNEKFGFGSGTYMDRGEALLVYMPAKNASCRVGGYSSHAL